jgi:hypothetical protein
MQRVKTPKDLKSDAKRAHSGHITHISHLPTLETRLTNDRQLALNVRNGSSNFGSTKGSLLVTK